MFIMLPNICLVLLPWLYTCFVLVNFMKWQYYFSLPYLKRYLKKSSGTTIPPKVKIVKTTKVPLIKTTKAPKVNFIKTINSPPITMEYSPKVKIINATKGPSIMITKAPNYNSGKVWYQKKNIWSKNNLRLKNYQYNQSAISDNYKVSKVQES